MPSAATPDHRADPRPRSRRVARRDRSDHLAVVTAADGIRFSTSAPSHEHLLRDLAAYVARRAPTCLWLADARRVRAALRRGDTASAVALYFARVGQRWDAEQLHVRRLP